MTKQVSPLGPAFGGFLDIAHGASLSRAQKRQLRFQVLFSQNVVGPDTFFHCYGPVFWRAKYFVDRGISPADKRVRKDLLMASIRSGAVLPALRTDASTLEENFLSDRVQRGQYLIPDEREGLPVLRFLDRLLNGRHAPKAWSQEHSKRSFHALHRRFIAAGERERRVRIAEMLDLTRTRDA